MKNASSVKVIILALISILATIALLCSEDPRETPTRGHLTMMTAEDVFPVIDLQVQDFVRVYDEAKIVNYRASTRDAVVQLLNDSVKLIVIPRQLNAEEINVVEKNSLVITSTKIAYDGVAVIDNSANTISQITIEDLHAILSGKIRRWSGFIRSTRSDALVVAMEGPNSGVYEYIKERISPNDKFMAAMNQCNSSSDVVQFVNDHANAIGFVAISWLIHLPENVNVLKVGDPNFKSDSTSTKMEYFSPHPANIFRTYYPMSRSVYIYLHNASGGVETGFTSFAAGVEGQRIIVKNGLVPATMPVRLVQLNNQ
jgi:phosphate transport system substrate-binding protein